MSTLVELPSEYALFVMFFITKVLGGLLLRKEVKLRPKDLAQQPNFYLVFSLVSQMHPAQYD